MNIEAIKWTGKQISVPGIYHSMPLSAYHAPNICVGPSISSSGLRAIWGENKSPKHFFTYWPGNPKHIKKPDSRAFIVGRAIHHLLLGERFFAKLFCAQPEEYQVAGKTGEVKPWNNNAQVCKAWIRAKIAEGRTPLTPNEMEAIKQMAVSVGNHPLVRDDAVLNGAIERSIFWRDKETGIWLKTRPDAIPRHSGDFADLKTTISTHWVSLSRSIEDYAYHRQGALLRAACIEVLKMDWSSFTLIFVEKVPPWDTRDVRPVEDDLQRGHRENRAAIRLFAKCLKENRWPGPGEGREGEESIGLSNAARERIDARLKNEGLADGQD